MKFEALIYQRQNYKTTFATNNAPTTINSRHNIHVALFDIFVGMLINAVLLAALSVQAKKPAYGHPRLVILVEEAASVAFHTEAAEPVPAYRLSEAPPTRRVDAGGRGIGGSSRPDSCRVCGGSRGGWIGLDQRPGGAGWVGGCGGGGVEAALEVEAENSLRVLHLVIGENAGFLLRN